MKLYETIHLNRGLAMNLAIKGKKTDINRQKQILTKALMRASEALEITSKELVAIIGKSEPTISRIFAKKKDYFISPTSKEGQLTILLLRIYRSLDALFGGNAHQCRLWLRSDNKHLQSKPIELIKSIEGLITTMQYLDAMRGKI